MILEIDDVVRLVGRVVHLIAGEQAHFAGFGLFDQFARGVLVRVLDFHRHGCGTGHRTDLTHVEDRMISIDDGLAGDDNRCAGPRAPGRGILGDTEPYAVIFQVRGSFVLECASSSIQFRELLVTVNLGQTAHQLVAGFDIEVRLHFAGVRRTHRELVTQPAWRLQVVFLQPGPAC